MSLKSSLVTLVRWWPVGFALISALIIGHFLGPKALQLQAKNLVPSAQPEIPAPRAIQVQLKDADGNPAINAVAVLLNPEFTRGKTNDQGLVTFATTRKGPVQILASLAHHQLLRFGPKKEFPADGLRFKALKETHLPKPELFKLRQAFYTATTPAIPFSVITLRATSANHPDIVAISDEFGKAWFPDCPSIELQILAHSPGFPPEEAWQIQVPTILPAMGKEIPIIPLWNQEIAVAVKAWDLNLENLSAGKVVAVERLSPPAAMPHQLVNETGNLQMPALPAGVYQVTVSGKPPLTLQLGPE